MVCCSSFCSFSPVLVEVQVLTYIFFLYLLFHGDDDRVKPRLNYQGKRLLLLIGINFSCFRENLVPKSELTKVIFLLFDDCFVTYTLKKSLVISVQIYDGMIG